MRGVSFLFKMVLRRISGWTSGQSIQKLIDGGKLTRCVFSLQVVVFDGGEYVSMAGEFNEFRKVKVF